MYLYLEKLIFLSSILNIKLSDEKIKRLITCHGTRNIVTNVVYTYIMIA